MVSLVVDDVPELPVTRAAVHALGVRPVGRPAVIAMLARLALSERLSGLDWSRGAGWLAAGDEQVRVAMNARSGGIRYTVRPLTQHQGDVTTQAPGLEQLAREFLTRLGRPEMPLDLERVTHLRMQTSTLDGATSEVTTLDAGLVFRRTVDDLPVIGPGGLVMVRIGADEQVVGGREVCRPVTERGPTQSLRTPEQAIDELRQRLEARGIDGEARARRAFFGYEERGIEEVQRLLQPVYAFVVEVSGEQVDSKMVEVIPAGQPPVA